MRQVTEPIIGKKAMRLLLKIIEGIKLCKNVVITPKEKAILEGVLYMGIFIKHIKVIYKTTRVRGHYRGNSYVRGHIRRFGEKRYYIDIKSLIKEYGLDYLLKYIKNIAIESFDVKSNYKMGVGKV